MSNRLRDHSIFDADLTGLEVLRQRKKEEARNYFDRVAAAFGEQVLPGLGHVLTERLSGSGQAQRQRHDPAPRVHSHPVHCLITRPKNQPWLTPSSHRYSESLVPYSVCR